MTDTKEDTKRFYYLKSIPHPSSKTNKYSNRYVRYTDSGHSDIVLTEAHPVYLKFYLDNGKQLASFKELVVGFKLNKNTTLSDALRAVEMFKDEGNSGFYFDEEDGGKLKWEEKNEDGGNVEWKGWVLRDCPPEKYKGNPQLFVLVNDEVPDGLERIDLIPVYL